MENKHMLENQEKWISLLAFKEALSDLKVDLDQNISTIFVFVVRPKYNNPPLNTF